MERWLEEKLKKYNMTRELVIYLEDITLDKNIEFDNDSVILNEERKKKFTCYICMAKFTSSLSLSKHKALHSDSELEDDIFDEEVSSISNVKNASKDKPDIEPKNVPIKIISTTELSDKPKSNETVTNETQKINTPFRCDSCDVFFEGSDDAKLHTVSNKCKYSCRICNRKFNTLYAFVVHVLQHRSNAAKSHNSSQMIYTCGTCKMSFNNCLLLRSHEINRHNQKLDNPTVNNNDDTHNQQSDNAPQISETTNEEASATVKTEPIEPLVHDLDSNTTTNEQKKICHDNNSDDTHNQQSDKIPQISETTARATVKTEPIEPLVHDLDSNTTKNEPNEICCDLCYDIFESEEELKSHMEFHEQLENKSETIVIEDDDEEVVEFYEEKKDPHEIITTIKSRPPQKKTVKTHLESYLTNPATSLNSTSNQKLSETIRDMLAPKVKKQSKTILLPRFMPNLIPVNKIKQKITEQTPQNVSAQTNSSNIQLRRTGPFSYSLHFKGEDISSPGSSSNKTIMETNNIGLTTNNSVFQNTVPFYGSALMNPNQPSSSATSNIVNNPNLQFVITGVPYVPELQSIPVSCPTIAATNNAIANTTVTLPTISMASTTSNNVTYVMSPTTRFTSPIVLNDPQKNLAYVILPHANNDITNSSTSMANTKPIMLTTRPQTTVAKEPPNQLSVVAMEETSQNGAAVTSTTCTTTSGPPVTIYSQSCAQRTSAEENLLPVLHNALSTVKVTRKDSTTTSGVTSKNAFTSGTASSNPNVPEPSDNKDVIESIVIDSDSSNEDNVQESTTKTTAHESESDELVIDESTLNTEEPSEKKSAETADQKEEGKTTKKKWTFPMKCDGCLVVFQRMRSMRHHLERRHRCQLCEFRCCKVSDFKQHYILEHRKFFCSRCSYLADTKTAFTEHNRRSHICRTCNGFYFNLTYHVCPKVVESDKNGEESVDKNNEKDVDKA